MNTEEFPKWEVNLKNMPIAGDKCLPQNLERVAMGVVIYDQLNFPLKYLMALSQMCNYTTRQFLHLCEYLSESVKVTS